ncbi:hypothetical protein ACIA8K_28310 [Catenuloplanes sp. NPDC051500]|uniref:hypothetical protein n=1 Tax=Catenuloplanes sp. NPDC051500 TaxID=3363959 RepID=UPI00378E5CDC
MHKSVTVLAAAAALTVTLAGCATVAGQSGGAGPAPVASSAPADPKAAFAAAFAAMNVGNFGYSMVIDETMNAKVLVDNDTKSTHAAVTIVAEEASMTVESYKAGEFLYTKMDLSDLVHGINPGAPIPEGLDGKKWLRLDPSRSERLAGSLDQVALDPTLVERSVLTIQQPTAHTFNGTLDLTRATPARFGSLDESPSDKAAREAAKNVPFHAETDADGRIAFFSIDVTDAGESATMKMTFGPWGTVTLPPVPAPGSYIDAPDAFYDMGTVTT